MTGVVRHRNGPRLYVAGLRVHHGSAGCDLALVGVVSRRRMVALAGVAMIAHDAGDFPWRDRNNHGA